MAKNKTKWVKLPLKDIMENTELVREMRERRKSSPYVWPYKCGDEIKWKDLNYYYTELGVFKK